MKDTTIIQGVIDLLAKPESWTKWAMARPVPDGGALHVTSYEDNAGYGEYGEALVCGERSPEAQSWCLSGALSRLALMGNHTQDDHSQWYVDYERVWERFGRLAKDRGFPRVVGFNNSPDTTHEDIMTLLKEALYDAQAEESRAAIQEAGL